MGELSPIHLEHFLIQLESSPIKLESYSIQLAVFQLENEKGRAPGRALCTKWAMEGTF